VRWRTGLLFGAASMVGAFAAGRVAHLIPGVALMVGFGALMVLTAWAMLHGKTPRLPRTTRGTRAVALILGEGLVVGAVTGLVGAGGGFLVVPALVVLGGLPMPAAIGTSLLVIVLKSGAALAGHLGGAPAIDLGLAGLVTGAAVLGSFAGAALSARIAPDRLRRLFAWFVVVMAVFLLAQEVPRAFGLAVSLATDWPWIAALVVAAGLAAWLVEHSAARRMHAQEPNP
jgi:uncharacterized membrane protein YfcA